MRERFRGIGADLGCPPRQVGVGEDMDADREAGDVTSSASTPEIDSGPRPEMIPAQDSPPLSVQLPSSRAPSEGHQHLESSFDRTCAPSQAPRADGAQYGE